MRRSPRRLTWPAGDRTPTPREAMAWQREMAARVLARAPDEDPRSVAGVDVSIRGGYAVAALSVLRFPDLAPLGEETAVRPVEFPYVPGLLAFREVPVILDAFRKLESPPDLLLVDGHGFAHPRRFGLACQLGVTLDLPAIGCGKTRFVGEHRDPSPRRGASVQLRHDGETIGRVLRTRAAVKPVYVSIGHRMDLATAVKLTLRCCGRYRLPEPVRAAHRLAGSIAVPATG